MHAKTKKTVSNLLLLGAFTVFALSSASSSQEREQNYQDLKDGFQFGKKVATDILGDNALPADAADSTTTVTLKDVAIR